MSPDPRAPGPRRALSGFGSQPVLVLQAADEDEARVFPERVVRKQDLSGRWARSLVHAVLFVGVLAGIWSPWHSLLEVSAPVWLVAVLLAAVLAVMDLATVRTWPMYVLGGIVVASGSIARSDPVDVLVVAGVFGGTAYGAWRSRRAQQRRWASLRLILEDGVRVHGEIRRSRWTVTSGSSPVQTLHMTVASAELPDRTWTVAFRPDLPRGRDVEPEVGDHVTMFVSRSHPEVAVLRPVVPGGRVGPRTGTGAGSVREAVAAPRALVVPAVGPAEARTFPRYEVLAHDVDAGNPSARRILHTALFLPAALATFVPLPGSAAGALGLLAIVLVVVDLRTVATWPMYAAVAAGSVALGVLTDAPVATTVFMAVAGMLGAYAAWHVRVARRRRWDGLRLLLDAPRLVGAVVLDSAKDSSGRTLESLRHSAQLQLTCPELPGHRWTASVRLPHIGAAPEAGDVLAMFVSAADPAVAVLRPVLPGATAGSTVREL